MDVNKYNIDRICRVCMSEAREMQSLFGNAANIPEILMTCSSVQVSEDDGLPSLICIACVHQANSAHSFKRQCELTDKILRKYLKNQQAILNDIKEEQNLAYNEFQDLFKPEISITEPSDLNYVENELLDDKEDLKTESSVIANTGLFECGVCGVPSLGAKQLTEHILEEHTNDIKLMRPGSARSFQRAVSPQSCLDIIKGEIKTYQCIHCCESFDTTDVLIKHAASHSVDQMHYCSLCNCGFTKSIELRRHNRIYHKEPITLDSDYIERNGEDSSPSQNSSEDSSDEFTINELLENDEIKSEDKPKGKRGPKKGSKRKKVDGTYTRKDIIILTCDICNAEFKRKLHLKRHVEAMHGEKLPPDERVYECSECKKSFAKSEHLKRHLKNHAERIYDCDECPKKFTRLDHLTEHKKRHTGERSFLCSKCGKGYFKQSHLDKHMLTHLNDHLEKPVYECSICGKKLNHSNHLQVHMRTHRDRNGQPLIPPAPNPNKKVILCSVCGKSCSSRSNLAVHMRRHTGQMTNFCKICGKGYPRTTDLTLHMRQHTGERPFVCSICNRGFARSDKLAIHMRTHTGEKPYVCPTCGRAFAQSNDLASHKRRNMCGQNNTSSGTPNVVHNIGQVNNVAVVHARAAELVTANVAQRLDRELAHNRVAEIAAHSRAVELAAQAAAHHSRVEYTDYTTATLLQNLSNNHFMR